MSKYSGKTSLFTGAGRGIGRHTALTFAAEGENVCINYAHSAAKADPVADAIEESGGTVGC